MRIMINLLKSAASFRQPIQFNNDADETGV